MRLFVVDPTEQVGDWFRALLHSGWLQIGWLAIRQYGYTWSLHIGQWHVVPAPDASDAPPECGCFILTYPRP
jgi:hypothetical protein